jgi:hypothetical protein
MIAAYAQANLTGPDAAQRATVRDAALDVAALVKDKKFPEALKKAETLTDLKADPHAKKEAVPLGKVIEIDDVMWQFRSTKLGGLGLEDRFNDLNGSPDTASLVRELTPQLVLDAYLTAVAAELTAAHMPKENAKDWKALSDEMRNRSLELAAAARKKDGKAAFQALGKLNRSCDKCHQQFRNQ